MSTFRKITIGRITRSKKPNAKVSVAPYSSNGYKYNETILDPGESDEMIITLSTGQKIYLSLREVTPGELRIHTNIGNLVRVAPSRSPCERETEVRIKTLNVLGD